MLSRLLFRRSILRFSSRVKGIDLDFFSDKKFSDLEFINPKILKTMVENQMIYMTNAQLKCINNIFLNNQTLNLAETGSGKTLMYLLPILQDFYSKNDSSQEFNLKGALIVTSTKELCYQIYRDIKTLDSEDKINVTRLKNISSITPLIKNYDKTKENQVDHNKNTKNFSNYVNFEHMDIVISTAHQIDTMIKSNRIKKLNPKYLVIDEADNLLTEKNHFRSLSTLFSHIKLTDPQLIPHRKVILTAATFPEQFRKTYFENFLKNYFPKIKICKSDNYLKFPKDIDHNVVDIENFTFQEKLEILEQIIYALESKNFLIFCNSNENIEKVYQFLSDKQIPVVFHSTTSFESDRNKNIDLFATGAYTALVCSDAINRGIHFDFPLEIIQFDISENPFDLIHRIGRTGRVGMRPKLTSMVNKRARNLLAHVHSKISKVTIYNLITSK